MPVASFLRIAGAHTGVGSKGEVVVPRETRGYVVSIHFAIYFTVTMEFVFGGCFDGHGTDPIDVASVQFPTLLTVLVLLNRPWDTHGSPMGGL